MRVAFITVDCARLPTGQITPGGSGYYRCFLPAQALSEFGGIETGFFADAVVEKTGEIVPLKDGLPVDGWDVVVLQRWMQPEIPHVTALARANGQIVVQDVDDHWWAIHSANLASRSMREGWNSEHYSKALRAASFVTVSTPFLTEVVRNLGQPNVHLLRNMIDLRGWSRQPVRDELRTIGWVGSTLHRSRDLEQLGQAVRRFCRNHPDVHVIHGGWGRIGTPVAKVLHLPMSKVTTRPLLPIDQYPNLWQGLDVALCPLNTLDFNRAKSAIKAMESSASGVPFVTSDLDEYRWYGQGLTASTECQWEQRLEDMTDATVRRSLADSAHERVLQEDVSRRWRDWLNCSIRAG